MGKHFEKVGRWDVAGMFTRNLKRDITEEMQGALKMIGLEAEGEMKKYIRDQSGNWPKLSDAYAAHKKRKGLSEKTLIASSSMIQSITSVAAYPRVFIGIKRGKKNKEGNDIANIAAVMEYGSKKMNVPARPFMQPVNEIMKARLDDNLLGKRILDFLRKKYNIDGNGSTPKPAAPKKESFDDLNSPVLTGVRGGKYKVNSKGNKVYQKRSK